MEKLTRSQRAADAVTEFCGSWTFIVAFSILTFGWIVLNSVLILTGVFDPYPYILLNLILTVVSTFQSPLIMMSQNRQMERDRDAVQGLHAKLDALAIAIAAATPGQRQTERLISDAINPEMLRTHSLVEIVKLRSGWLLKFDRDSLKELRNADAAATPMAPADGGC